MNLVRRKLGLSGTSFKTVCTDPGNNLTVSDGHFSQSSSTRLPQVAKVNDVMMLILPSHTTRALQILNSPIITYLKHLYNNISTAASTNITIGKCKDTTLDFHS
jgi:outer membrane lipoprotein-sorting protein